VRAPVVLYNRANEAAAKMKPGDFNWQEIFAGGVRWFHSGGIFAALSDTTGELIVEAMKARTTVRRLGTPMDIAAMGALLMSDAVYDAVYPSIQRAIVHTGVDGRRYLVIHGDIFDLVVQNARWLAHLGDKAYDFAIQMNRFVNMVRRWFGVPYWSLSQWAKLKVKNAVNYIGAFEKALATEARHHRADGVICGHIHTAAMHDDFGLRYINCGDWVESCTALAEHEDGRDRLEMEIVQARPSKSMPSQGIVRIRNVMKNQNDEIVETLLATVLILRRQTV